MPDYELRPDNWHTWPAGLFDPLFAVWEENGLRDASAAFGPV